MQEEYKKVNKKKIINLIVSIFAILIMSLSSLFLGYFIGKEENNNITINEELRNVKRVNYNLNNDDLQNLSYNLPLNYHLNGVYQLNYQSDNLYYYELETYNYKLYYRNSESTSLGLLIDGLQFDYNLNVYQLDFTPTLNSDYVVDEYNGTSIIDLASVGKSIVVNQYFENNYDFLINIYLGAYDDSDFILTTNLKIIGGISTFYNYTYEDENHFISNYGIEDDFSYEKSNSFVLYYDNLYYLLNKTYENENAYQLGYEVGYDEAYDYAYNLGLEIGSKNNFGNNYFKQLFNLILNAPYNIFHGMLNFEIFGINLFALFSFIFTTGLILFIINLFRK